MSPVELRAEDGAGPHARSERPRGGAWLLTAIVAAYGGVLLVGPIVAIAWGAFAAGVGAFLRQLMTADALNALKLTLLLGAGATALNTCFGVCLAWVLARDEFRGRRLLNALVDLPFVVSPVIAGFVLFLLFGRGGWFTPLIDALNLQIVFAWPGMLLVTTFVSLPFVVREVVPVLRHVGVGQEQAAFTMGASPARTFREITLPNIRWGLLYGISLTFARALGEFGAVLVVSGGVSRWTETSTLFIFRALDDRNQVGANAMALALAAISFSLLMGMEYFRKHRQAD